MLPSQQDKSASVPASRKGIIEEKLENDDDIFIALPILDDIPVLLPSQNRMKFDTFLQHERRGYAAQLPPSKPPQSSSLNAYPIRQSTKQNEMYDRDLQMALRESAMLANTENMKLQRLRERLEKFTDFELEDVDNTGHCQFDAIAHQIAGRFADQYKVQPSEVNYRRVRRDVAEWLRRNAHVTLDNGATITNFLDHDDGATWEIFCDNIEDKWTSPSPVWGNHLTLIAAANCYNRPIRIWSTAPGEDWWLQIEPKHYKPTHHIRPFELAHLYERHYLSVRERRGKNSKFAGTPRY